MISNKRPRKSPLQRLALGLSNLNTMSKQSWRDFYSSRVGSRSYQEYFDSKYKPMVDYILGNFSKGTEMLEEGIGMGSLANSLIDRGIRNYSGYDNSTDMMYLCKINTHCRLKRVYFDTILDPNVPTGAKLFITHGVLEHFSDDDVQRIVNRYKSSGVFSVHYVPLDKYEKPSYGDERLLPYRHWIDLVNPTEYYLFNDGYDLLFTTS